MLDYKPLEFAQEKSRELFDAIITKESAAEKKNEGETVGDCGSLLRKRFDEAKQKRNRCFRT